MVPRVKGCDRQLWPQLLGLHMHAQAAAQRQHALQLAAAVRRTAVSLLRARHLIQGWCNQSVG